MTTTRWAGALLALGLVLVAGRAGATNLTLPVGGRVAIDLVFSEAAFSNTLAVAAPAVAIGQTGCTLEPVTGLGGVRIGSEKFSQRGCRVELDADPATPGVQPFAAGTAIEFRMCAQTNADPACEFVWSSNPAANSDGFDHLRTTQLYPADFPNRIFQLAWEDLPNGGDLDFNDLIAVLRVDMDTDGDGLWDDWEQFGIDTDGDGVIDIDLPNLLPVDLNGDGDTADPGERTSRLRKDIFLEIDYMDCAVAGGDCAVGDTHSHRPIAQAIGDVVQAFRSAPVTNPDGSTGITLHVDVNNAIAHADVLNYSGSGGVDFDDVKAANFDPNRRFAFHYCLFTHNEAAGSSVSGRAEIFGNDCYVSLGLWTGGTGNRPEQAGTLMHEFGHNLNLLHGGGDNDNYKPNHLSVMSYRFQTTGIPPAGQIDYSRQDLPDLNENSLDETVGIQDGANQTRYSCPSGAIATGAGTGAIDWNCDLDGGTDVGVAVDVNRRNAAQAVAFSVLAGFDDWANIRLDFQTAGDFQDGDHFTVNLVDEITREEASPPVAAAGTYVCTVGQTIQLDGTGSFDRFGTIVAYEWNFPGGGPVDATGPTPAFNCASVVGRALISLTVEDDDGFRGYDRGEVEVRIRIDIKPGSYPNSINLGSDGTVPVAILSHLPVFDATAIDPTTVTLAGASVQLKGKGTPMASRQDVDGDGALDLVVHVSTEALQLTDTDTEAVLEATAAGGVRVRGVDSVRIVP